MGYRIGLGWAVSLGLLFAFGPKAPAAPVQSAFPWVVTFATAPAPSNTWYAPWSLNDTPSGSIAWTVESSGGAVDNSGNGGYYRGVRDSEGSSVQVLRYSVPAATNLYFGCWMRCPNYDPAPGDDYWMEAGVHMGDPVLPANGQGGPGTVTTVGQHFDDPGTGGAWTVFKKFDGMSPPGPNHDNGSVWTWYYTAAPIHTGANTVVNIGFKVGALYDQVNYQPPAYNPPTNAMDVGYDGLTVFDMPLAVPPATGTFNPPPAGGSGGGGTGAGGGGGGGGGGGAASNGDNDNGDGSLNDKCHCSVPATDRWAVVAAALALGLGVLFLRRR